MNLAASSLISVTVIVIGVIIGILLLDESPFVGYGIDYKLKAAVTNCFAVSGASSRSARLASSSHYCNVGKDLSSLTNYITHLFNI